MNKRFYFWYFAIVVFVAIIAFNSLTPRTVLTSTPAPHIITQQTSPLAKTQPKPAPNQPTQNATTSPRTETTTIRLIIASSTHTVYVTPRATVLDAMRTLQSEGGLMFSGREYPSLGFFVDSIDDKKNANGYDWFLYINNQESSTGASQTTLHDGDVVEWRFEKSH